MVELVVATLLVGVLMSASLTAAGQSLLGQRKRSDRIIGQHLAHSLLQEVLDEEYEEPDGSLTLLGVDSLETVGLRSSYDDVDDYDGYSESPPKAADGSTLSGYTGWSRTVQVDWLDATTLNPTGSTNTGVKRVRVTVAIGGVNVYSATSCKVNAS